MACRDVYRRPCSQVACTVHRHIGIDVSNKPVPDELERAAMIAVSFRFLRRGGRAVCQMDSNDRGIELIHIPVHTFSFMR